MKEWLVPVLVVGGLIAVGFVIRTWVLKKASTDPAAQTAEAVPCLPAQSPGFVKVEPPAQQGDRMDPELGNNWPSKYHPFIGYPKELAPVAEVKNNDRKDTPEFPIDDVVLIPAGEFLMGDDALPFAAPKRKVFVEGFKIDRYEVTNAQYKKFIDATGHPAPDLVDDFARDMAWRERMYPGKRGNRPVVLVGFEDARAYCQWASKRLPTEAEWEKAARGAHSTRYPWGDEWDGRKSNTVERVAGPLTSLADFETFGATVPVPAPEPYYPYNVGSFAGDKSPYGVMDMHGNVAEWVDEPFKAPEGGDPRGSPLYAEKNIVVVKGVGTTARDYGAPSAARFPYPVEFMNIDIGFRCAADQ